MGDARLDEFLALVRELDARDVDVAARLDRVLALLHDVDSVRARAHEVVGRLEGLPEEIGRADASIREAESMATRALAELAEAESRSADVHRSRRAGADRRAEAERALKRATVASADSAAALVRGRERRAGLEQDVATLEAAAEGLAVESRELAKAVAEVPRLSDSGRIAPGPGLDEIDEWGARAHAALFVVRGSLETERERLVHEANTLAAAILDDHSGGASVSLVRSRIEAAV